MKTLYKKAGGGGEPTLYPPETATAPRVAFFPDSFHEVNGVAHTGRNFVAYAERNALPFLCVRAGSHALTTPSTLELPRSRAAIRLEKDLEFDPLFLRHYAAIGRALRRFRPDILHITGPSELGIAGAWFAWRLGIPLAASWHTNVHEYAARRTGWLARLLPSRLYTRVARFIEAASLWATTRFYARARVLYAPNPDLCRMLEQRCHRPCHLMQRGVDTSLFTPDRRTRLVAGGTLVIGYVGRLSVEKNVAALPLVAARLRALGITNVRFRIIGHGNDEAALRAAMPEAGFPGVLRGEALAQAYADMDLLFFPSHTDTFGNVVLEALASGVPALVTAHGGPRHIVQNGVTGFVAPDHEPGHPAEADAFAQCIADLAADRERLLIMARAARLYALTCSWDEVFDRVYAGYGDALLSARSSALTASPHRPSSPR